MIGMNRSNLCIIFTKIQMHQARLQEFGPRYAGMMPGREGGGGWGSDHNLTTILP